MEGQSSCIGDGDPKRRLLTVHEDGDLPEWFLSEILIRLAVKTIFMFRCVSKQWNSLISEPSFAHIYVSRRSRMMNSSPSSSSPSFPWTILHRYNKDLLGVQFKSNGLKLNSLYSDYYYYYDDTCSIFSVLDFGSALRRKYLDPLYAFTILGSSDGLLLCREGVPIIKYYVCNPLTGQWVALPYHTKYYEYVSEGFVTQVEDGIVTSYKVVRLQCTDYYNLGNTVSILTMEIFASETGQWSSFFVDCHDRIPISWRRPVSFNGILHWFSLSAMVAFDPYNVTDHPCRLIKLPIHMDYSRGSDDYLCDVSQGRLQLFVIDRNDALVKLWVLEDYDTGKWHLEHSIRFDEVQTDSSPVLYFSKPLAFHPFYSGTVYLWCDLCRHKPQILSFNIRRLKLLQYSLSHNNNNNNNNIGISSSTVFPFVLPLWPSPVPQPQPSW